MASHRDLHRRIGLTSGIISLCACASQPPPPPPLPPPNTTVYFYPARGQSADQQERDKYECNQWAVQQSGFDPSAPNIPPHLRVQVSGPSPAAGVATGAVAGAALGAIASPPWHAGAGAAIGGAAGALLGGVAAASAAEQAKAQAAASANNARAAQLEQGASNFRRAMSACLEGRGYNVR
jgi:hypothetical protein